jgi:hypothetical protein
MFHIGVKEMFKITELLVDITIVMFSYVLERFTEYKNYYAKLILYSFH